LAKTIPTEKPVIIDASNLVLGRLASMVAKNLLSDKAVVVVNAEKAVVTGARSSILKDAHARLKIRNLGSKSKSPKHPRRPDGIVLRTVRGMLPRDKEKGKLAFSRLRVYIGVPEDIEASTAIKPKRAESRSMIKLTTVGEIAESMGWRPMEV